MAVVADSRPSVSPAVSVENLVVAYENFKLGPINVVVHPGQWVGFIGRSGCGKSTLLRSINLLATPKSGRVSVFDRVIFDSARDHIRGEEKHLVRREVGMVFQGVGLWPYMTLRANVMEGLTSVRGKRREEAFNMAQAMLDEVGVAEHANKLPREVSGGQAQRAGIARALAMEPRVLLCDEITSGLDPIVEVEILDLLAKQQTLRGLTILMATHRISYLLKKADRVLLMDKGKVIEEGQPGELISSPKTTFGRQLLSAALG